jgi:hypothetical protein
MRPDAAARPAEPARDRRWRAAFVALHLLAAVGVAVQHAAGKPANNFRIFRGAGRHLLEGRDLYAFYPAEHADLFKYSPSVALGFVPFALVPEWLGLLGWHLLNAGVLVWAVCRVVPARAAWIALAGCLLEALGAMQNAQANGLCAGLMLLALDAAARDRPWAGALAVATGTHVKLFPAAAGVYGAVHPRRVWHVALMGVGVLLLALLPLVVVSPAELLAQYRSWRALLAADSTTQAMWWVGGIVERYTGRPLPHAPIQLAGTALVLATAWRWRHALTVGTALGDRMRLAGLVLGYVILFNHRSEPPTFVIAYAGLALWWATQPRAPWRDALCLAVLVLGSLGGTDLVPRAMRVAWHQETRLKAIVVLGAWVGLVVEAWRRSPRADDADAALRAAAASSA